jgi:adhesin HecA-like repeat protein
VNYNSVVYHAVAGQRMTAGGNTQDNYAGLVRQYGAMGLKALSELHNSAWQKRYFSEQYQGYLNPPEV